MTVSTRLQATGGAISNLGQLPVLKGWYVGNQLAGADTDPISQWDDASGNGNHATQGTAGNRPLKRTNIINGLAVARFVTDDWLSVAGLASVFSGNDKAWSVITVGKANALADGGWVTAGNSGDNTPRLDAPSLTAAVYRSYRVDDAAASNLVSGGTTDTSAHVISLVCAGTTIGLWVDGTAVVASGTAHNVGQSTYDGVAFGAVYRASPVDFLNGDLAEIAVCATILTPSLRNQAEKLLGATYGITVA